MSLVAYAASSDDESETEIDNKLASIKTSNVEDYISDEEEFLPESSPKQLRGVLNLPVPKLEEKHDNSLPFFGILPPPKTNSRADSSLIEEEDDEFLHKKAVPLEMPKPTIPQQTKNLVQIKIPSLKDFDDVEERKEKKSDMAAKPSSFSSLISILPRPKSEQSFVKDKTSNKTSTDNKQKTSNLIPDTVKNRRPAQNTENVDRNLVKRPPPKPKPQASIANVSDSDGSDSEDKDFFSLTTDDNLPEVSADEISAMVSKKAAEMAQASSKFIAVPQACSTDPEAKEPAAAASSVVKSKQELDNEAIQALMGSQAKRRKVDEVEIIDISSDQVLPNKDEWLRTALASATTYQATGVLTDEEPAAGTRRKHQITYLAHKAKANEAELQAMWSANRQNRRQTQSKYGF